jgi:ketosteroid isomerase-like protein
MIVNMNNAEVVRSYLQALERFAAPDELQSYFADDVVMTELPNRLVPSGQVRRKAELLDASMKAPKVLSEQRYDVRSVLAQGDTVVVDVDWSATIRVPLSQTPAGGRLNARIAMFLRLDDGRIVEQTNFDCYQPF